MGMLFDGGIKISYTLSFLVILSFFHIIIQQDAIVLCFGAHAGRTTEDARNQPTAFKDLGCLRYLDTIHVLNLVWSDRKLPLAQLFEYVIFVS